MFVDEQAFAIMNSVAEAVRLLCGGLLLVATKPMKVAKRHVMGFTAKVTSSYGDRRALHE